MRFPGVVSRILVAALPLALAPALAQQGRVKVPMQPEEGFGPFAPFVHVSVPGENGGVWQKAQAEVRGVPVDLHGFSIRYLNMQMDQYIYQSCREGLIDSELGRALIARRSIDTTRLSKKHVDQDIPIVAGIDPRGNTVYVVDTKDDHSFWGKDKIVIPPYNADSLSDEQMDSLNAQIDRPAALYEYYDGTKIRETGATLRLSPYVRIPPADREMLRGKIVFGISVYEHRRGLFNAGGRAWALSLSNGFFSGVYGEAQDSFAVYPARDTLSAGLASTLRFGVSEKVAIGDSVFRISDVAVDGSIVTLGVEKAAPADGGIARGSRAPDFEGVQAPGDTVSLRRLGRRYVLLVFWRPGTPASDALVPYLNDVQQTWGERNLSVIGMPLSDGRPIRDVVAGKGISWRQLPVDPGARVLRDYAVLGYPSMYLIDPDGRIAANEGLTGYAIGDRLAAVLGDSTGLPALAGPGNVAFQCVASADAEVALAGDFTGWLPVPMYRTGGAFSRRVSVPPGKHFYRFCVNGTWVTDPSNDQAEKDPAGQMNSVIVVH